MADAEFQFFIVVKGARHEFEIDSFTFRELAAFKRFVGGDLSFEALDDDPQARVGLAAVVLARQDARKTFESIADEIMDMPVSAVSIDIEEVQAAADEKRPTKPATKRAGTGSQS